MPRIAVSFCNVLSISGQVLFVVDLQTGEWKSVQLGPEPFTSACGIVQDAAHLYAGCTNDHGSYLAIVDKASFELSGLISLGGVSDIHSICLDGDAVIAASTGSDEIVRIPLADGGKIEVLWRANEGRSDTHHLNAVLWSPDGLLCSGFGLKQGARWASATDGYVYNVTTGEYVVRGVFHPHSLAFYNDTLYFCESSRSNLRTAAGVAVQYAGYQRGLAFLADGTCYVGESVGRADRALAGVVLNPADSGDAVGRCSINIRDAANGWEDCGSIDLSQFGSEIYDILPL